MLRKLPQLPEKERTGAPPPPVVFRASSTQQSRDCPAALGRTTHRNRRPHCARGTGPSTQRQPHPMAAVPSCPGGNTSQTSKNRRGLRKYATLPPCLSQHNGRRRRGPKPAPGITRKRFRKSPQRHPKIDPEPPPKTAPDTTQIGRFLRVPKRDKNARKKQKNIAQQWRPPSTKIARDNRLPQGPDRPKHDPDLTNNAAPSLCPRHTAPWTLATLQAHMTLPRSPEDHVDLHTERRARA